MSVDLPPAEDELGLLVSNLLQALQVFEGAGVEDHEDILSGALHHGAIQVRLPAQWTYVLFIARLLEQK